VADLDSPFLLRLPETDRLSFRNLALIRPQLPSERQLELVESFARNLNSPRLLTLIARTPHWLVHGPVLHALAGNENAPEAIRRDLELAVSLFDLLREMERAPEEEKEERAEAVKAIYQQLPPDLKPVVKQLAKQLAKPVHATGTTMEMPHLPGEDPDWELLTLPPPDRGPVPTFHWVPKRDRASAAESTLVLGDLQQFLTDEEAEVRAAALKNPGLSEELLLAALPGCANRGLFEEIYQEARWYFRDPIREALSAAPWCPE